MKHPALSKKSIVPILLALFFALCYFLYHWQKVETTDNAYVQADISDISIEVPGIVNKIFVENNNFVKKDTVIAKIDDTSYRIVYKKALSNLEKAQAHLALIQKDKEKIQITWNKNKNLLSFNEKTFATLSNIYNRSKSLNQSNVLSQDKFDASKVNFEQSENTLIQARFAVDSSKLEIDKVSINEKIIKKDIELLTQELNLAKNNLHKTEIRSPIDGIIANSSLQVGNFFERGRYLFSVVPQEKYIIANFKETQVKYFSHDMPVEIYLDSLNSVMLKGKIKNIAPATSSRFSLIPSMNVTGNFVKVVQRVAVLIEFDVPENMQNKILPGMSATVKVKKQ